MLVLKERPHPQFSRQGNDLVYAATITLAQALTGCIVNVTTLDRRTLPIPVSQIVK